MILLLKNPVSNDDNIINIIVNDNSIEMILMTISISIIINVKEMIWYWPEMTSIIDDQRDDSNEMMTHCPMVGSIDIDHQWY